VADHQVRISRLVHRLLGWHEDAEDVVQEVFLAALILVSRADRMARDPGLRASAMESYRRVIRLFPQTIWSQVAREKLTEIQRAQGEKL